MTAKNTAKQKPIPKTPTQGEVVDTKKSISKTPLISIITPVFNAEKFITETIQSVQAQTYKNWELILVDDESNDNSTKIIEHSIKKDPRIKLIENTKNQGAAKSRNKGIDAAEGAYLCFIDADDFWRRDKLKLQLEFMQKKDCAFSFTSYEFADANGRPNGKRVSVPTVISYHQALKNTTIWTSTVMFNMNKLTKSQIHMPNVKSEDTATWWKILKNIKYAYGLNESLSYYRRTPNTLSANKFAAIKRIWNLYRNVEKLSLLSSAYYFCAWAINATRRRIK